jgi:hypothetical protein
LTDPKKIAFTPAVLLAGTEPDVSILALAVMEETGASEFHKALVDLNGRKFTTRHLDYAFEIAQKSIRLGIADHAAVHTFMLRMGAQYMESCGYPTGDIGTCKAGTVGLRQIGLKASGAIHKTITMRSLFRRVFEGAVLVIPATIKVGNPGPLRVTMGAVAGIVGAPGGNAMAQALEYFASLAGDDEATKATIGDVIAGNATTGGSGGEPLGR